MTRRRRMRERVRRLADDLTGRSHRRVLGILLRQIDEALAGAALAVAVVEGTVSTKAGRARMLEVEHAGDGCRGELAVELSRALTTPVDREDLFRISRAVDDVLDNLRDYVRESDLFQVVGAHRSISALTAIGEGLTLLRQAVVHLSAGSRGVAEFALAARKRSGRVRRLYQAALADLFEEPISAQTLKRRELLRRLDVTGLCLGECADALNDAMFKRGI